jgi:hypothetical protein
MRLPRLRPPVATVLCAALLACSSGPGDPGRGDQSSGDALGTHPLQLLYSASGTLLVRGLHDGRARSFGPPRRGDVFAAQGSRWVAEVVPSAPSGDEDFLASPRLVVWRVGANLRRERVGPGVAPVWDSGGRWVAYLRPKGERACAGELCRGTVAVAAFNPATGVSKRLLPAGHYALLAFSHRRLWVADQADLSRTIVLSLGGTRSTVPIPPSELWDVSPDGRWLVRSTGRSAELIGLRGSRLVGPVEAVPLAGRLLADGSWAHDSSRVAAVLLPRHRSPERARVSLFSPQDPVPRPQAGTRHAVGQVVWAPNDSKFAVVRAAGRRLTRLQATLCRLASGRCSSLFSWVEGVVLLRLQRAVEPAGATGEG